MRILGIDPGLDGGIAMMDGSRLSMELGRISIEPMPTTGGTKRSVDGGSLCVLLRGWIIDKPIDHVFLERVGAMPGQGVTSMFNFGEGYGVIKGVLSALHIPYTLVSPQKWQNAIGVAKSKDTKGAAATRAAQLFPGVDFRASARCRKPHDGMVDAALIAAYGVREWLVGNGLSAMANLGTGRPQLLTEGVPPPPEVVEELERMGFPFQHHRVLDED